MASSHQQQQRISPRKFSEKIALLNQKEAEGTAAFNQILKEVEATRTQNPTSINQNYQPGYLNIQQQFNNCRSLPNVNQCLKSSGNPTIRHETNHTFQNHLPQKTNGLNHTFYDNVSAMRSQGPSNHGDDQQYNDNTYSYNEEGIYEPQNQFNFDNQNISNEHLRFDSSHTAEDNNDYSTEGRIVEADTLDDTLQSIISPGELDGHLAPPNDKWRRSTPDSALNHSCASSSGTSPVDNTAFQSDMRSDNQDHLTEIPDISCVYLQEIQANQTGSPQINEIFDYNQGSYVSTEEVNQDQLTTINDNCGSEYVSPVNYQSFNEGYSSVQQQEYDSYCMPLPKSDHAQSAQQNHLRPKSCEVPGINICTIEDEHSNTNSMLQVSTSNTGSLPNLTNSDIFHSAPNESSLGSKSNNVSSTKLVGTKCHKERISQHDQRGSQMYYDVNSNDNNNLPVEQHHLQQSQVLAPFVGQQLNENVAYDNRLGQPHQALPRSSSMTNTTQRSCYTSIENFPNFKGTNSKVDQNYVTENHTLSSHGLVNQITRSSSHNNLCYRYQQEQQMLLPRPTQQQQPIQNQFATRHYNQTDSYISQTHQDPSCDKTIQGIQYNSSINGSGVPSPSSDQGSPLSQYSNYSQQSPQSLTEGLIGSNNISSVMPTTLTASHINQTTSNCNNDHINNTSLSANPNQQPSSVGPCRSPSVSRRSQNHAAYKNIVPVSRNFNHNR